MEIGGVNGANTMPFPKGGGDKQEVLDGLTRLEKLVQQPPSKSIRTEYAATRDAIRDMAKNFSPEIKDKIDQDMAQIDVDHAQGNISKACEDINNLKKYLETR